MDVGVGGLCESLDISRQPSIGGQPGECPFDDPSLWENLEAFGLIGSLDDLDPPWCRLSDDRTGIAAITNDHLQEGEACRQLLEEPGRAVAILDTGGMDIGLEEKLVV